jgi:hypothetical protein
LVRIAADVLRALKRLVFGGKSNPIAKVGDDMLSNVRFNTAVIMKGTPSLKMTLANLSSFQAAGFGTNDRLTQLRKAFFSKVGVYIKDQPDQARKIEAKDRFALASKRAAEVAQQFRTNGFPMNMQETSTFHAMVQAFMTEAQLNPNALVRVQELYTHVTKNLKYQDFMADPESHDDRDTTPALAKFNALMGVNTATRDELGRTTLMASFLALANVDESFREVLRKIEVPRANKTDGKSVDEILTNFGTNAMDRLGRTMSGEGKSARNVQEALDTLTDVLAENALDQQNYIDQFVAPVGNTLDRWNSWLSQQMDRLGDVANKKMADLEGQTSNKAAKGVLKFGQLLTGVINEDRAEKVQLGLISTANRIAMFAPLHDMMNEVVGRTSENKNVFDLIKRVRAAVDQIRQQFREETPRIIASKFSRKLSDQEWTHLYQGLAKTDLAALGQYMPINSVITLLQDFGKLKGRISGVEELLQEDQGSNWPLIQKKAKELARYMNTGHVSGNPLFNAEAIANLLGEVPRSKVHITQRTIRTVDELVTLYALDGLSTETKERVSTLAQTEAEGIKFAYAHLEGRRKDELSKLTTDRARLNHYKGHAFSENDAGLSMVVADGAQHAQLLERGYTMVGRYEGSPADRDRNRLSYYFAPVSGKGRFNQGILQNVRATASGVDPVTGFTMGSLSAGRITDPKMVRWIDRSSGRNNGANPFRAIYDGAGDVVAFERTIDPSQEAKLQPNTNLSEVLGIWRGRQIQELKAAEYNKRLIDELGTVWEDGAKMHRNVEFVDLFDPKLSDPVMKDAVSLITEETREYIRSVFGDEGFMVRRDMINDAVGYRAASVGDSWNGTTRLAPGVQESVRKLAMGIMGNDAYKYLVQAESAVKGFVGDAKQTIVVKSVVVPAANLVSNMLQLVSNGVPLKSVLTGFPKKAAEIDAYVKNRLRKIELETELGAARGDLTRIRQLKTEIHSIEDSFKRLSIWPLIEAGEFNSISEASIDHDTTLLTQGKMGAYVEKLVDKLPEGVRNLGRYAYISKDTALFQGLQKTVEYGDFMAKAVLYEDQIKRLKRSQAEALELVTDEFIHYDRLSGRVMDVLDNIGIAWFWKFKVRSVKTALRSIRRNPLHVLMASLVPMPDMIGSVGLPLEDNVISQTAEGAIHWSIGPGQGLRSIGLNPWVNLIS